MNYDELESVVQLYGHKLFRYAYSILCDYHDAEDVVQDVFIAAMENSLDSSSLAPWLFRVTHNKCVDYVRRRKFVSINELQENMLFTEHAFDPEYSPAVISALKLLSKKDRAILMGRITESLSYKELAQRMDMSESALRKRYERAKKKVRDYLIRTESEVALNG